MPDEQDRPTYARDAVYAAANEYFRQYHGYTEEQARLPAEVWTDKYALRDREERFYETTPADMHWREANEFARIEAQYPNPLLALEIFEYLDLFDGVVPQGSPMFGIGNTFQLVSLSNCAVRSSPKDTMSDIMNGARDLANLFKRRFGAGLDLSLLRPDGASVNNAAITSTGAHSFMPLYSDVTRMVGQAGRRGALMLTMHVLHPDVERFITKKSDLTQVTGANVSVRVSDDFMRAVEEGRNVTLRWPVDARASTEPEETWESSASADVRGRGTWLISSVVHDTRPLAKFERTVNAADIFRLIAEQAAATAEPGVLFWDAIQRNLPLDFYRKHGFETISTNPCGELPLCGEDSCRLLAIPVARYVRNAFRGDAYFDWAGFKDAVRVAMRLSDDLVDLEIEKLYAFLDHADTEDEKALFREFIRKAEQGRRTGLGLTGVGDMLAMLRMKYDTPEAVAFVEEVYKTLKVEAYRESVNLAKERGPFPIYDATVEHGCEFIQRLRVDAPDVYADMLVHGRRNGAILTQAPTGTLSLMARNCSSGLEPMFMAYYTRNRKVDATKEDVTGLYRDETGDYWKPYKVFHPNVEQWLKLAYEGRVPCYHKTTGVEFNSTVARRDNLSFERFVEDVALPDFFVGANDIDWRMRIAMQAAITRHLDHSASSTINLPAGTTADTIEQIYLEAWRQGCKGVTVYVDGSREAQVLSSGAETKETVTAHITSEIAVEVPVGTKRPREVAKEIPYWPYCETCKEPFDFEKDEPFAYCGCGTTEWGYPRPASYVAKPATFTSLESPAPPKNVLDVEGCLVLPPKNIFDLAADVVRGEARPEDMRGKRLTEEEADLMRLVLLPAMNVGADFTRRTQRGRKTHGDMTKVPFHDPYGNERKVYVYVGTNDRGEPVEVFITDGQGDPDVSVASQALAKLISLALKEGVPVRDVADALIGLKGGSVGYAEGIYQSVPDLVGKLLLDAVEKPFDRVSFVRANLIPRSFLAGEDLPPGFVVKLADVNAHGTDGLGNVIRLDPRLEVPFTTITGDTRQPVVATPTTTGAVKGFRQCPGCLRPAAEVLVVAEGCPRCIQCGWSKCG